VLDAVTDNWCYWCTF